MKVVLSAPGIAIVLFMGHLYAGLAFTLGPPRSYSSGSYQVAMSWLPADIWGAAFLVIGALTLLAPHMPRAGSAAIHILSAAVLLAFASAIVLTEIHQTNNGWGGGLLHGLPAAFHLFLIRARYRTEAAL